jgi:hypothetical protein
MDVALSFHIGLWSRVMARESYDRVKRDSRIQELLRRLDVAGESLDRAKEVEDFQSVGMRLRELLLTLTAKLSELELRSTNDTADPPKKADFKAWAVVHADSIAAGGASERLRSLLKATSAETWAYVNWLTHARNASEQDARIAFSATHKIIEAFLLALTRVQRGQPERCPVCTSYRLELVRTEDGQWVKLCAACGSASPADAPLMTSRIPESDQEREPPEGDCVEVEDFGIYLSPSQARSMIEKVPNESETEDDQPTWTNPFAYLLDDTLMDVHRIVFMTFEHQPSPGTELVYQCSESSCVNAEHAVEEPLPNEHGWRLGIVEKAVFHPSFLELHIGIAESGIQRAFVKSDVLDRYGFGDVSSLIERPVFVTASSDDGWVQLVPAARRLDYSQGSPIHGWLHPSEKVNANRRCPCNSGRKYSACHGERLVKRRK